MNVDVSSKQILRKTLLAQRRKINADQARHAGNAVAAQLEGLLDWGGIRSVHIYHSLPGLGEVSTEPVVDWLMKTHPHIEITVGDVTPRAAFPQQQFDVIFVPVVGFDRGGFRLGLGGGWYDRWLATQPGATTIGLAYAWSEVDTLPCEPHDIALDFIVTDAKNILY